jgi:DNA-directed RNA polymerase subunit RPC12/RpoP
MVLQAVADRSGQVVESERCQVCGAKVVVKNADEIVIKNAILRVDGASGRVSAKCSRCKAWVAVPLTYTG